MSTGEVVTTARSTPTGDDLGLTGGAITTAARIQSMARPGEILLDTATVAAARTVDVIERPAKPTCAPCHDGQTAFKLTGHSCGRCHGAPAE